MTCRICLEEGELDNPLLLACQCKGSAKYIHFGCLSTWLQKKLVFQNN
jgi:E3 ubiquitin-protein ligase DOA10